MFNSDTSTDAPPVTPVEFTIKTPCLGLAVKLNTYWESLYTVLIEAVLNKLKIVSDLFMYPYGIKTLSNCPFESDTFTIFTYI